MQGLRCTVMDGAKVEHCTRHIGMSHLHTHTSLVLNAVKI